MLNQRIETVLTQYAKIYNLTTKCRIIDRLYIRPRDMTIEAKLTQTIAERGFMIAKLTEFILLNFADHFEKEQFTIDPEHTSFLASHYDDSKWHVGDYLFDINSGRNEVLRKKETELHYLQDLFKSELNFISKATLEIQELQTNESKLIELCAILESFCHNRVLFIWEKGILTEKNYQQHYQETWPYFEKYRKMLSTDHLSAASIFECHYTELYEKLDFPPVLTNLFYQFQDAIRSFNFRKYVKV